MDGRNGMPWNGMDGSERMDGMYERIDGMDGWNGMNGWMEWIDGMESIDGFAV